MPETDQMGDEAGDWCFRVETVLSKLRDNVVHRVGRIFPDCLRRYDAPLVDGPGAGDRIA